MRGGPFIAVTAVSLLVAWRYGHDGAVAIASVGGPFWQDTVCQASGARYRPGAACGTIGTVRGGFDGSAGARDQDAIDRL